jgi:hypothetical protein
VLSLETAAAAIALLPAGHCVAMLAAGLAQLALQPVVSLAQLARL